MGHIGRLIEWLGLAAGFAAAALALFFYSARRRILRRAAGEGGERAPLLATGARVSAGDLPEGARARWIPGMLVLLGTGLYFHSWTGNREVFIPGAAISWIGLADGRRVVVRFLNAEGKEDGVAILLLFAEHWVAAIKTRLITRVP